MFRLLHIFLLDITKQDMLHYRDVSVLLALVIFSDSDLHLHQASIDFTLSPIG